MHKNCASFDDDPQWWAQLMGSKEWPRILDRVFVCESATDNGAKCSDTGMARAKIFKCSACDIGFASQKACDSHARAKHGIRSPFKAIVPPSVCPCCGTDFRVRVRCLSHLATKAVHGVVSGYWPTASHCIRRSSSDWMQLTEKRDLKQDRLDTSM